MLKDLQNQRQVYVNFLKLDEKRKKLKNDDKRAEYWACDVQEQNVHRKRHLPRKSFKYQDNFFLPQTLDSSFKDV